MKGLGETVAKTAETLNRSENQSEVRTSRVAFCIFLWELNGELKRAIDLSQKFCYFELRDESWERPKVSKLKEAFEAMKRRQEEFNLQTEVRHCKVQRTTAFAGSFLVQATQRKQLNTIREDMRSLASWNLDSCKSVAFRKRDWCASYSGQIDQYTHQYTTIR